MYIIIRGPMGCGKTTIAKKLAEKLKIQYISVDRILEKNNLEKWEDGFISEKSFLDANKIITEKMKDSAVIDGNFYCQIIDLIERVEGKCFVFTLKAPVQVCIERDDNRENSLGEDAVRAVYSKTEKTQYGEVINSNKPADECVNQILLLIKSTISTQ